MKYQKYILLLLLIISINISCPVINADIKNSSIQIANIESPRCSKIFGSRSDPNSLNYLINDILKYPRIIVPLIVIVLGSLDLAKAILAPKEDEMKKAQKTFIKRVLIGITIYLVPIIVNLLMYLADIVWEGAFETCGL